MVESLKNCLSCDTILRPNAVFCHHCGRSLSIGESNNSRSGIETQNLSAESLPVEDETALAEPQTVVKKIAAPVATMDKMDKMEIVNGGTAATVTDSNGAKIANIQTGTTTDTSSAQAAAPIPARRTKRYVSRTEYVWEDSNAPTGRIVLFSLLALLLIVLLLWLNNFLR